jgi:hypothetical protein
LAEDIAVRTIRRNCVEVEVYLYGSSVYSCYDGQFEEVKFRYYRSLYPYTGIMSSLAWRDNKEVSPWIPVLNPFNVGQTQTEN